MLLKTAICDDDSTVTRLLQSYIKNFEIEFDIDFETTVFTLGEDLLTTYHSPGTYNVLFLDVEMPGISGLEVAAKIRELSDTQAKIVFISNYPEYMQDSFEVQAYNYLSKPLEYETFRKIILKIVNDYKNSHITKLIITANDTSELINIYDIICIQSLKENRNHLEYILKDRTILGKGNIGDCEKELTDYNFISPHRGILVNINHIHYFKNSSLILTNNMTVPVSRRKENEIRELFSKNILQLL